LAIVVLWLVFSYVPRHLVSLPNLSLQGPMFGLFAQWALVASLVVFLAIQAWLIWVTVTFFRNPGKAGQIAPRAFGLKLSSELFWTAIPLVMTIGLALISYQTWYGLVVR
jgi:heme/copper-type cytochrome/quinol oxidase subunit 2